MAGSSPCADVRVNELERLKINMHKFLQYGFPKEASWQEFGWTGRPIEIILDNIASWISRKGFSTSVFTNLSKCTSPESEIETRGALTFRAMTPPEGGYDGNEVSICSKDDQQSSPCINNNNNNNRGHKIEQQISHHQLSGKPL